MTHTHLIRRSLLAAVFLGLAVGTARAGVVININQVGSDVVMTGSGSINLTDLTHSLNGNQPAEVNPTIALLKEGLPTNQSIDIYNTVTGPTNFGTGPDTTATTGTGDIFGIYGGGGDLYVPSGYVSGTSLSASDTYSGQTFFSLGLTPGTYTWTWGTGANADFLTVNISGASVPEPSAVILAGIGAVSVVAGVRVRKRRDQRRRVAA